ncbi:MAG: hypothetical protein ACRDLO_12580 [Solirubrobacterales bacterium]
MDWKGNGALVALLGVAAAIILFVVLSEDEDEPEPAPTTATTREQSQTNAGGGDQQQDEPPAAGPKPEKPSVPVIEVKGGEPVGGVKELSFAAGDQIRFVVESDVADTVHLHGYDVEQDVSAGGKTSFDLPADIEGVFEVELEERVVPIAEITVNPS